MNPGIRQRLAETRARLNHPAARRPPTWAAVAVVIPTSLRLMFAPDMIYVPLIVELPLFLVSFAILFLLNELLVAPLARRARAQTRFRMGAPRFAGALAVTGTIVLQILEVFGRSSSLFSPRYIFLVFVPVFVLALMSYWYSAPLQGAATDRSPDATGADNTSDSAADDGEDESRR